MYLVRTEYRNHDKSTYFRLKHKLFVSHMTQIPVHAGTYRVHIFFCLFLYRLFYISKGTYLVHADSGGVQTFWFLNPDSIERPPGCPAGLLASDSGTGPCIEPNHTKALAVLFTAA